SKFEGLAQSTVSIGSSVTATGKGSLTLSGLTPGSKYFMRDVIQTYPAAAGTQFNITKPGGSTLRFTYITGPNPNITATTVPVGSIMCLWGNTFNGNNNGRYVVTG